MALISPKQRTFAKKHFVEFEVLLKNSSGKGIVSIIKRAINSKHLFVFGEILNRENVQKLKKTDDKKWVELLEIFAFGTFQDYQKRKSELPEITEFQTHKLKMLTIVSLAYSTKHVPYPLLQKELEISEVRELEDLIIDSIYMGLIVAKLDQKESMLEVQETMGRDVPPREIGGVVSVLEDWLKNIETLLELLSEKGKFATLMSEETEKKKKKIDSDIDDKKKWINILLTTESKQEAFKIKQYLGIEDDDDEDEEDEFMGRRRMGGMGGMMGMGGMGGMGGRFRKFF
ncbi:cop9 signalosome complex subunit 7 [Anaeramoeba flamelloides]|uniref:Cop9 signalosome complex subunit 7 n=1 Tax=Anaeramoeba flamelloides TaxID=1746091 RepID=A0ABQ8YDF9_9EUKA|nr:cop9 signalosome complex subunit 7 [Anaeramoeba flamelloides]